MPTPIVAGDVLEAKIVCYCIDQVGINVRHYQVGVGLPGTVLDTEVAARLSVIFSSPYAAVLAQTATFRGIALRRLDPNPTGTVTDNSQANGGTSGPSVMARQATGIVTLNTGTPGRAGRGRAYIPFPSTDDDTVNGIPVPGYVTNVAAIGAAMTTNVTVTGASGGTLTLIPVLNNGGSPPSVTFLTGYIARTKWATQKRRGSYGKPNAMPF